uniref:DUF4476 domain-containing protein n=1 Tax=Ascaris lumbricoides TaxID=6252 RepID=A0A0M3IWR5_ASCLU
MTNDQSATQIELLRVLRANKATLMERDRNLLEQLERVCGDQVGCINLRFKRLVKIFRSSDANAFFQPEAAYLSLF